MLRGGLRAPGGGAAIYRKACGRRKERARIFTTTLRAGKGRTGERWPGNEGGGGDGRGIRGRVGLGREVVR